MKALLLVIVAACASAPAPKPPDETHRVPVNRTVPPEVEGSVKPNQPSGAPRQQRPEGEVEWR